MCFPLSSLPKVNAWCCCFSLRTGTIIIGLVQLFGAGSDIFLHVTGKRSSIDTKIGVDNAKENGHTLELTTCTIICALSIILLVGVFKVIHCLCTTICTT